MKAQKKNVLKTKINAIAFYVSFFAMVFCGGVSFFAMLNAVGKIEANLPSGDIKGDIIVAFISFLAIPILYNVAGRFFVKCEMEEKNK